MMQLKKRLTFLAINLTLFGFSNAQVAINNTNPQGTFHVDGAKDNAASGTPTATQQANDFVVKTDGKVGIGTTTPTDKVEIVGGDFSILNYTFKTAAADDQKAGEIKFRLGGSSQEITTPVASIVGFDKWNGVGSAYAGDLAIKTQVGPNLVEQMRVTSAGNVGIGVAAPVGKLQIQTPVGQLTDALVVGINNCGGACSQATPRNITLFNANSTNDIFGGIDFIPSVSATGLSGAAIWGIDRDFTNHYAGLQFYTRNATGYAPRMTIRSSGNVGIGTTDPKSRLHISTSTLKEGFQLQDGSQGAGKILTSDAQGKATWNVFPAITQTVLGTTNTVEKQVATNTLINSTLALPTGKWLVYIGQLVKSDEVATYNKNFWMRISLSSSNTSNTTSGFSFLGSSLVSGYTTMSGTFSFLQGVIPVNVTAANTTLYTWFTVCDTGSAGKPSSVTIGNNSENYLFAVPIN